MLYGFLCLALTVVAAQLGDVLQAALGLFGMIGGPLLGLFFLGIAVPFANWIVSDYETKQREGSICTDR